MSLRDKKCIPCEGGVPPLALNLKNQFMEELHDDWCFENNKKRLKREVSLKGFKLPLEIANKIGEIADEQWHHPDLYISFNTLIIEIWTHKIDDLVESDFIFASKLDGVLEDYENA